MVPPLPSPRPVDRWIGDRTAARDPACSPVWTGPRPRQGVRLPWTAHRARPVCGRHTYVWLDVVVPSSRQFHESPSARSTTIVFPVTGRRNGDPFFLSFSPSRVYVTRGTELNEEQKPKAMFLIGWVPRTGSCYPTYPCMLHGLLMHTINSPVPVSAASLPNSIPSHHSKRKTKGRAKNTVPMLCAFLSSSEQ